MDLFYKLENGSSADLSLIPVLNEQEFRKAVIETVKAGSRIETMFAMPEENQFRIIAILLTPAEHVLNITSMKVADKYQALTPELAAAHLFEREIAEQYGILPEGHPNLKPVRFHESYAGKAPWTEDKAPEIGNIDFMTMQGKAAHEVAVGPIHAGVIEPGHFRFQCMGEDVYSLEISLGYQHRGIEKMLEGKVSPRTIRFAETAAGDSSIAEATACASVLEALDGIEATAEARKIRSIALELERIANHVGDLGALAGDVAFLPTSSFCGRIRGEYLNMTAELCGNRFGRSLVVPGGVKFGIDKKRAEKILQWINRVYPELKNALDLMFDCPTVLDRLENTGRVEKDLAKDLGLVGMAGRASGLLLDTRYDLPLKKGDPRVKRITLKHCTGEVMARALVRYREIETSHEFIIRMLMEEFAGEIRSEYKGTVPANKIAVSVVESWRGELCHAAVTGEEGTFRRYKITDPSFHNWTGLAMALRGEQISNFPICNKSFNLSYCGHDL
ncbi:MAG: hydrogenase [Lentisphaerae bacterium]|nr:hydrogenase [Lentisphaerota bacterium]